MSESNQKKLHAVVHGRVQGVGFRDATVRMAQSLGVTGWVQNRPDSTVETVAVGDKATLERFLAFLNEGPAFARVEWVEASWFTPTEAFVGFGMR